MKHDRLMKSALGACIGLPLCAMSVGADTLHTIDVLGIYPDHVAQRVADPEAMFASNIEYANKTLQNSGANYRYNLVHVQQQNWSADSKVGSTELVSLARDPEGRALREQYGADLVAGLVPTGSQYCGIGYLPSANSNSHTFYYWASRYAYSLSGDTCGGRTMAHEMGHTMGLGHRPAQGSTGTVATWGRGWGVNGSFVTVMAYNSAYGVHNSGGRLQIHSNPDLSVCLNLACGQPINLQDGANATLALNLAAPQVANWMPTMVVPQNDPPVAQADSAMVDAGDSITIDVLSNDSDPNGDAILLSAVTGAESGSTEITGGDTQIVYTPNEGFVGQDSFSYTVMDANGASAQAMVSVQVNAVEPPPGSNPNNLALNGDAESGTDSWQGWWGTSVASSNDAHSGAHSVLGVGGRGVVVELDAPFNAGREFSASAALKSTAPGYVYAYLRLRQGGVSRYWYLSARYLTPNQWVDLQASRTVGTQAPVEQGEFLFYFPYGIPGSVVIDDVVLE